MSKVVIYDHPLIQHKLGYMRNANTSAKDFKQLLKEITMFMGYEITRDEALVDYKVQTPHQETNARKLKNQICIAPILRAGMIMSEAMQTLIPTAVISHIGVSINNITQQISIYYSHLPSSFADKDVIICDPMLGNGIYIAEAIKYLQKNGAQRIKVLSLIATQEGIDYIHKQFPAIPIYIAHIDQKLDEKGQVFPGLGHAGDRIYGTMQ